MDDVRVLKAADNMNDRVNLTDICKKLVSKSLTFGRALYEAGDINELDYSRCCLLRVIEVC